MSYDWMLDEPEFDDGEWDKEVDEDFDFEYDDCLLELDIGDYRSDEYERTINQNY